MKDLKCTNEELNFIREETPNGKGKWICTNYDKVIKNKPQISLDDIVAYRENLREKAKTHTVETANCLFEITYNEGNVKK